jgi:dethiobiotin synthetase
MNAFITGTNTGAGKTFVTSLLIRGLRARGVDAVGFKPICCGGREDAQALRAAGGDALTLNEVNPVWLRTPAAPYTAAMIENRQIDLALVREVYAGIRSRHEAVLVEGVGGWLVPILHDYLVADLAHDLDLPVIIVVANRLGALNHAALTLESVRSRGASCAGLILNEADKLERAEEEVESIARATNRGVLEGWLGVKILYEVQFGQQILPV